MGRVLVLLPNDQLGGAEQFLKMTTSELLRQGYYVDVYFLKKRIQSGWDDIRCDSLSLHYMLSVTEKEGFFLLLKTLYKHRNLQYTYVFTSHLHCSSFVGILRKCNILKTDYFIARESTSVFRRFSGLRLAFYKTLYKLGYPSVDLLICQTDYMKEQLIKGVPGLEQKIKIRTIPNPIDLNNIRKHENECFEISDEIGPYIVSAGRLIPEKGYDILIDAFAGLRQTYPNLKLLILGEGKERKRLQNQINDLGLKENVCLYGHVRNVYPFLKNAALCVVSSRIEGFPNILLQMMSQNTKVVSTLCAGEIENINGLFTCEVENTDRLKHAIHTCIQKPSGENRDIFNLELQQRSITAYIRTVNQYLREP